ncbi:MAG TPA: tetratricopeptide repeat protein, partial [Bacteroidia bacterium]|nr:tetratricopeptide repeat protein [Bacteroidia bacterium]
MAEAPQSPRPSEHPQNLDALSASEASGVVDAIERNRNKLIAAIVGGAVILCAILVFSQIGKQKHLAASAAYTSAASKGEIAALDGVIVDFPGSVAAGNAMLTKAELQIAQGKQEDARATLEKFVAEFASHPRHVQGIFALANVFHLAGDREMAKSHYERVIAVQKDGDLTPLARIRLGDLALEAGDAQTADQRYQESFTLHPGNPYFDYAEQKIALLKVGNPPVIDRPAPPAPPAAESPKPETPKSEAPAAPAPKAPETPKPEEAPKPQAPAPAPAPAT